MHAVIVCLSLASAVPGGHGTCGYLEWFPHRGDMHMGLNHQMASLSLGEAYYLQRTLLLPRRICLFALHEERWKKGKRLRGTIRHYMFVKMKLVG